MSQVHPILPRQGLQSSLIAGLVAGVLSMLQSIALNLLNRGTFQQAQKDIAAIGSESLNVALALAGLAALTVLISLLICGVAGYIVGKIAVQRRLGFLAGALAGAITYIGAFVVRYVPSYPGNMIASGSGGAIVVGAIVLAIVFLLIWALIGGLVGLLGAWIATRKHSYYVNAR